MPYQDNNHTKMTPIKLALKGKVIISGEYSVVHGKPAIALPTLQSMNFSLTATEQPSSAINFQSVFGNWQFDLSKIQTIWSTCFERWQQFTQGKSAVQDIFQQPDDFIGCVLALAYQQDSTLLREHSRQITVDSHFPIGSGLGSSAVVSSGLLRLLVPEISDEQLFKLVYQSENLVHGRSGGLDAWMAVKQVATRWQHQQGQPLTDTCLDFSTPSFSLVFTGKPICSTGECVTQVNQQFSATHPIWHEFSDTTEKIAEQLKQPTSQFTNQTTITQQLIQSIRNNNQLLTTIGVVPNKVQQFFSAVKQADGAGKIVGAGAIRGETAGVALVVGLTSEKLQPLLEQFNYTSLSS